MTTSFRVNGREVVAQAEPIERLSDALRNALGLTGTKVGCDAGDCGACTVLLDGKPVCSCLTALGQVQGRSVETVEGLSSSGELSALQQSFLHYGAAQCGICTPGMLMTAQALLNSAPRPSRKQVEDALGGVLCRCTGYRKIVDAVMNATTLNAYEASPRPGESVGCAIRHLDGAAKVTGRLTFGADAVPNAALAVRVIRSPHHLARFTIGDHHAFVGANDGVECVLSANDIPGRNCHGVIPPFADQPVFAERIARFRGEAVAAVVGEIAAVEAFDEDAFPIVWNVLEPALTPDAAMQQHASALHVEREDNVLIRGLVERGDAAEALGRARHVVRVSTSTPFVEHGYIEPEAGYASWDDGRLTVYGCTQAAQMDREALSQIMNLPLERVRVVPSACGGGFGSKLDLSFQPYVALAAWKTHRPTAICYSRSESMRCTTKRHPSQINLEVGCDENGKITGFDFDGVFNTGAYSSWGPTVANRVPVHASGPYFIEDYRARSVAVHTATVPAGAFRGFGVPQSAIAQECAFDELADRAGIDRLEFRVVNALKNGDATVTGQVLESGVGIVDCLKALGPYWQPALGRAAAFNRSGQDRSRRRGVGLASCWYGCGNTSLPNPSTIRIGVTREGRIVLHQGAMDIGQGANTVITQIAADAIGVPVHAITLVGGDTDLTPDCGKTSASRQTYVTGCAAKLSGEALRRTILRHSNAAPDSRIEVREGRLALTSASTTVSVAVASLEANQHGYVFMAEETYDPPTQPLDAKGQGVPYAVYGYGAQLVELCVDVTLGTVEIDHVTSAHDVGRAINPLLVEGQIEGGVAQGIGMALMEDYQPMRTENLHDYLMPTIGDMPQFTNVIVEVEDALGPYGAKGLGEHVLIPTAPAIVNAIRHATGAIVRDLPATPGRVLAAIRSANEKARA